MLQAMGVLEIILSSKSFVKLSERIIILVGRQIRGKPVCGKQNKVVAERYKHSFHRNAEAKQALAKSVLPGCMIFHYVGFVWKLG